MGSKPIFIDRDGVINVDVTPYVSKPEQLQLFPWTVEALRTLNDNDFDIFVISNQQGVALGITKPEDLNAITDKIQGALMVHGFQIRHFYHCTALDAENHPWRKPSPGMVLSAREDYGVKIEGSFFIGDKWSDIECGARAGCRPLLVLSGVTAPGSWNGWKYPPEQVFGNLKEAVDWVVAQDGDGTMQTTENGTSRE